MTSKIPDYDISVDVNFEDGVGEIAADAFKSNLPEGLTEDHFDQVDNFRDQFAASVGDKILDMADDHFANNEGDISVADYSLGGNATLAMTMSNDYQLVTSITVAANEALDAVNEKAKEMFKASLAD